MRYIGDLLAYAFTTAIVFIVLQWAFDLRRECGVYIKGFFWLLGKRWRGSDVMWTVHKFGDEYKGRIEVSALLTYRLLGGGGASWHVAFTKSFHTRSGAETASIKLAKRTVCFHGKFVAGYFPTIVTRLWEDRDLERDFLQSLNVKRVVEADGTKRRPMVDYQEGQPAPNPESWGYL